MIPTHPHFSNPLYPELNIKKLKENVESRKFFVANWMKEIECPKVMGIM